MSDTSPGLGDLLSLLGGANPLSSVTRSYSQMQKGITEFLQAMENFNVTMAQLNGIAERVNRLLDDVEPPIRALMPQLTRSITMMDEWAEQLSAPIERVAPGLSRLADTLSSPVLAALPTDLGAFVEMLGDVARRMQPLGQLAEAAGGMFGMRQFAGLLGGGSRSEAPDPPAARPAAPPPPAPPPPAPAASERAEQAPAKQSGAKKAAAKRTPATKSAAKKPGAKGAATKRTSGG